MKQHLAGATTAVLIFTAFVALDPRPTPDVRPEGDSPPARSRVLEAEIELAELDRYLAERQFQVLNSDQRGLPAESGGAGLVQSLTRTYFRMRAVVTVRQEVFSTAQQAQRHLAMLRSGRVSRDV